MSERPKGSRTGRVRTVKVPIETVEIGEHDAPPSRGPQREIHPRRTPPPVRPGKPEPATATDSPPAIPRDCDE